MHAERLAILILGTACALPLSVFFAHALVEKGGPSRAAVVAPPLPSSPAVAPQGTDFERPTAGGE